MVPAITISQSFQTTGGIFCLAFVQKPCATHFSVSKHPVSCFHWPGVGWSLVLFLLGDLSWFASTLRTRSFDMLQGSDDTVFLLSLLDFLRVEGDIF